MSRVVEVLVAPILMGVLNSLWQTAMVAAVVWLALKLLMRWNAGVNAATRHAIWWATLAVLILLPATPWIMGSLRTRAQPAAAEVALGGRAAVSLPPATEQPAMVVLTQERSAKWPLLIAALWAAVFLYRLVQITRSYFYLRGVKARATVSPQPLPGARRRAELLLSGDVRSPMAVGFLHPAVVLPESLPAELEKAELEYVLLHETAHIARLDDWTNLAVRVLEAAVWLHPVAPWILRQIEREREIACDDWVVARTGDARPYAASLARMFELRWSRKGAQAGEALASGIFGGGSRIGERIELLLRRGRGFSARVSVGRVAGSAAVLLALAAAGSVAPRWFAFAQSSLRPGFEVASVKVSKSTEKPVMRFTVGRMNVENLALRDLISVAYRVKDFEMANRPGWIHSERYSIDAKTDGANGADAMLLMLQTLLEDRFQLRVHRETKEGAVYVLTLAKGGSKLHEASCVPFDPNNPRKQVALSERERTGQCSGISLSAGALDGNGMNMEDAGGPAFESLAGKLAAVLDRPVINRTGLTGRFDVHLRWNADQSVGGPQNERGDLSSSALSTDQAGPSIFAAVQEQLGLKLEPARGPVKVLVIDHAERPSAN